MFGLRSFESRANRFVVSGVSLMVVSKSGLATGGRLEILLSAAEFATSRDVDPDGAVARSLCLAVDPDLLVTVNAMTAGYVVADAPDGLGAAAHPGTGQAAAVAWLDKLRGLAKRMCVASTPYAQADLGKLRADERICDIPVLFLSSKPTSRDVVDAFACGGDDFLPKPFRTTELAARIFGLLRRAQLARAATGG